MKQHKRYCDGAHQSDLSENSNHGDDDVDDDNEENYVEVEFVGDDELYEIVYL